MREVPLRTLWLVIVLACLLVATATADTIPYDFAAPNLGSGAPGELLRGVVTFTPPAGGGLQTFNLGIGSHSEPAVVSLAVSPLAYPTDASDGILVADMWSQASLFAELATALLLMSGFAALWRRKRLNS